MKGFTFFENFFDSISDPRNGLSPEEEGEVYRAILYYVFRGEEIPLEGAGRMAFNLIRPSLDISRVRSAARRSAEKPVTEESDINGGTNENQTAIKSQSNENQTEIKSENLTFLEETETERSIRTNERNKKNISSTAGARESYASIMESWSCSRYVKKSLWKFIRSCAANGDVVSNDRLNDLIGFLYDKYGGEDEQGMLNSIDAAVRGGYSDFR